MARWQKLRIRSQNNFLPMLFYFWAKVGREFLWHGPPHTLALLQGDTQTHTHTHMGQGKQSHRHKTMLPNCRKYETTRHQQSLITIGCDRDRNIIFDILDIHMYTYACALCEVFPFLFADFFTWRQNVNKSCRYRWHILQVLHPTNCSNINSLSIFCDTSWKLLPVAILYVDSTNFV